MLLLYVSLVVPHSASMTQFIVLMVILGFGFT